LEIECVDENGVPVKVESIEPQKVEMYVPADSRLKAQALLTSRDITQAKLSVAVVFPYVELAPGQTRQASRAVNIKMSSEADSLTEHRIVDATLEFGLSKNLLGAFDVEVSNSNYNDLVSFFIYATEEAKDAYENKPFQITLNILDDDAKKGPEEQRRAVVYNFPEEYVRKNEIRLRDEPEVAVFKLIPLKLAETSASGTN
jgi:hypothetical protein